MERHPKRRVGASAPTIKTIYFWVNQFKSGCKSTKDEPHPGRPKDVLTEETDEKRYCCDCIYISKEHVGHTMYKILGIKKLSAGSVPHSLIVDHKCE